MRAEKKQNLLLLELLDRMQRIGILEMLRGAIQSRTKETKS
jgi:hypothetical protein